MNKSTIYIWIFSLLVLVCGSFLILFFLPDALWENWQEVVNKNAFKSDYVSVVNQPISNTFFVKSVRLAKPGFVELFYSDWYISPGDVLMGDGPLLSAGEFQDVPIEVLFPLNMQDEEPWQSIGYVAVFYDNGDGIFRQEDDVVAKDHFGNTIVKKVHFSL